MKKHNRQIFSRIAIAAALMYGVATPTEAAAKIIILEPQPEPVPVTQPALSDGLTVISQDDVVVEFDFDLPELPPNPDPNPNPFDIDIPVDDPTDAPTDSEDPEDAVSKALTGVLESPQDNSYRSGIGVISGWYCDAEVVEVVIAGTTIETAYGTIREDTLEVCGDIENGFGVLYN